MSVSLIVALSDNGVIGRDNQMPWHLSGDLQRFKRLTMGHHMIMGRKTFESIGRLLPGRTTILLTRNESFSVDGALTANSLEAAIQLAGDDPEIFIVGGGEIYRQAIHLVSRMYVTRVHCTIDDGDVTFPDIDWNAYTEEESVTCPADKKNDHNSTFIIYNRKPEQSDVGPRD